MCPRAAASTSGSRCASAASTPTTSPSCWARIAGVTRREVGYAGMKDRNAVTVQCSACICRAGPTRRGRSCRPASSAGGRAPHRKLKTGALAGNCFTLVLRECVGDAGALAARVRAIAAHGVPNYFGEQRFGHDGDNIAHARAMLAGTEPVGIATCAGFTCRRTCVPVQRGAGGAGPGRLPGTAGCP